MFKKRLKIAVVGAAGNVGTHVSVEFINAIRAYYTYRQYVDFERLCGQYSDSRLKKSELFDLLDSTLSKNANSNHLPIEFAMVLNNAETPGSSSYHFNQASGIGFEPAKVDQKQGGHNTIFIPKTDFSMLGVKVYPSMRACRAQKLTFHLVITVVTEAALLNDDFCETLGQLVHRRGFLALSMNGVPPYFNLLFDDPDVRACEPLTNRTQSGRSVVELLGGVKKLIGVVLTVADHIEAKQKGDQSYHLAVSSKSFRKCMLGSRRVDFSAYSSVIPASFFHFFGSYIGLGTLSQLLFKEAIFRKLAVNIILNPISALLPQPVGDLLASPPIARLIESLNEQLNYAVATVLGCAPDNLYNSTTLQARLLESKKHIASTGQKVLQRQRVEYINLRALIELIKAVAKRKQLHSVPQYLEMTTALFDLFGRLKKSLDKHNKSSKYPIDAKLEKLSQKFQKLVGQSQVSVVSKNPAEIYFEQSRELLVSNLLLQVEVSLHDVASDLRRAKKRMRVLKKTAAQFKQAQPGASSLPTSVLFGLDKVKKRSHSLQRFCVKFC